MVERGKPADFGQEVIKRRARLTRQAVALSGRTVLDYGCGNGAQTSEFLGDGCSIIAADVDLHDLELFKEHVARVHADTVRIICYDGRRLPVPDASVDVVTSYEVLEHVEDESVALKEIARVLKPGGDLVMTVPNKWWLFETHGAYLPLLPWNRVPFFSWLPRPIHDRYARARIYRKKDIVTLLSEHSFHVLETAYIKAPMDVVKADSIQRLLRGTIFKGDITKLPFLSTAIFLHAVRT